MTNAPPDLDNASLEAQLNEGVEHHRAGRLERGLEKGLRGTRQMVRKLPKLTPFSATPNMSVRSNLLGRLGIR